MRVEGDSRKARRATPVVRAVVCVLATLLLSTAGLLPARPALAAVTAVVEPAPDAVVRGAAVPVTVRTEGDGAVGRVQVRLLPAGAADTEAPGEELTAAGDGLWTGTVEPLDSASAVWLANGRYRLEARALAGEDDSAVSDWTGHDLVLELDPPTATARAEVTPGEPPTAVVTWDPVDLPDFEGYVVERSADGAAYTDQARYDTAAETRHAEPVGAAGEYRYRVRVTRASALGAEPLTSLSAPVTVTVPPGDEGTPPGEADPVEAEPVDPPTPSPPEATAPPPETATAPPAPETATAQPQPGGTAPETATAPPEPEPTTSPPPTTPAPAPPQAQPAGEEPPLEERGAAAGGAVEPDGPSTGRPLSAGRPPTQPVPGLRTVSEPLTVPAPQVAGPDPTAEPAGAPAGEPERVHEPATAEVDEPEPAAADEPRLTQAAPGPAVERQAASVPLHPRAGTSEAAGLSVHDSRASDQLAATGLLATLALLLSWRSWRTHRP